jgi:hypothetical protein
MALGPRVGYDCRVNNSPPQWVGALLDVVERIRFMVTARRDRRRGRASATCGSRWPQKPPFGVTRSFDVPLPHIWLRKG